MFKDILLYMPSYPRPAPEDFIREAVGVARTLSAHITALVGDPDPIRPISFYRSFEVIDAERRSINRVAQNSLAFFREEATRRRISHEGEIVTYTGEHALLPSILERARMRDLTLLPFLPEETNVVGLTERLIFESGRPVLILPSGDARPFTMGRIVVAWDFGRPAARALADSIPLLQRASQVQLVTVVQEKLLESSGSLEDVAAHLLRHEITAGVEYVDAAGRQIGDVLTNVSQTADLLVMGAFGHSRMRDFVLGGATRSMLQKPPIAVLLSH